MKNVPKTVAGLAHHFRKNPLTRDQLLASFVRFARYQLAWRLSREPTVHPWIGSSRLIIGAGMRGVTGDAYMFLDEPRDMLFCAHLLRPGDLFFDVGANVGSYSVIAAKVCGARAVAFEPASETIEQLLDNLRLNGIEELVRVEQCAISNHEGTVRFTSGEDALNRVSESGTEVRCRTLDSFADEAPLFVKVDVEGHEREVVEGAEKLFSSSMTRAVTLETPIEYRNAAFVDAMRNFGFDAYDYDPSSRELTRTGVADRHNTLFVKDVEFVADRLRSAAAVQIAGKSF
jgi:FkbM family methyltransferase